MHWGAWKFIYIYISLFPWFFSIWTSNFWRSNSWKIQGCFSYKILFWCLDFLALLSSNFVFLAFGLLLIWEAFYLYFLWSKPQICGDLILKEINLWLLFSIYILGLSPCFLCYDNSHSHSSSSLLPFIKHLFSILKSTVVGQHFSPYVISSLLAVLYRTFL